MATSPLHPRCEVLLRLVAAAAAPVQPGSLEKSLHASRPTINRALRELVAGGLLDKLGDGRSTRYAATHEARAALAGSISSAPASAPGLLQ